MVGSSDQQTPSSEDCSCELLIDLSCYSLTAVKKACYKFSSECSIAISKSAEDKVRLSFKFPCHIDGLAQQKLISDFHCELTDQDLREIIFKETEVTRNLILAHAFSKTALIQKE